MKEYDNYLDKDLKDSIKKFRKENNELYLELNDLLKICDETIHKVNLEENIDIYIVSLFSQIIVSLESANILLERGFRDDALIIIRNMYENSFKLNAVIKDKENYNNIIESDKANIKKINNKIRNNNIKGMENLKKHTKEIKEEYKKTSIYEWAEKADMLKDYLIKYICLSDYTHTSFAVLKEKVRIYKNGICNISAYLNYENSRIYLFDMVTLFLKNMIRISEYFKIDKNKEVLNEYLKKFNISKK